jgi:PRC-barrel domain
MRRLAILLTGSLLLALAFSSAQSAEPAARTQPAADRLEHVKATLLGTAIYDDNFKRIGVVDDIVATRRSQLYAIVRTDDVLHSGSRDLSIPLRELESRGGRLVLPLDARAAPAPLTAALRAAANAQP